jgi:hypothetical protein
VEGFTVSKLMPYLFRHFTIGLCKAGGSRWFTLIL